MYCIWHQSNPGTALTKVCSVLVNTHEILLYLLKRGRKSGKRLPIGCLTKNVHEKKACNRTRLECEEGPSITDDTWLWAVCESEWLSGPLLLVSWSIQKSWRLKSATTTSKIRWSTLYLKYHVKFCNVRTKQSTHTYCQHIFFASGINHNHHITGGGIQGVALLLRGHTTDGLYCIKSFFSMICLFGFL